MCPKKSPARESQAALTLNLYAFLPRSRVNGPGERAVVWVQGCSLACPGCWNSEAASPAPRRLVPVQDVAGWILGQPGLDGVTFSGGEPFEQAGALTELAVIVRRAGLSVLAFSGYTLEEIKSSGDPHRLALLSTLDVLIDGRFDRRLATRRLWRSSSNQRVHFLTPRYYAAWADKVQEPVSGWEVAIAEDGRVLFTGFPDPEVEQVIGRLGRLRRP